MYITITFSDTYRQEVFQTKGTLLPKEQRVALPDTELSPESRAIVTQANPTLTDMFRLQIPNVATQPYPTMVNYEANITPTSPQEWDALFSEYAQVRKIRESENLAYRQEQLDAMLSKLRAIDAQGEDGAHTYSEFSYPLGDGYKLCEGYEEAKDLKERLKAKVEAYYTQQRLLRQRVDEARDQQEYEVKRQRENEKAAWIAEYGSPSLSKKYQAGYDCQRQYAYERAAQECPDYRLDFDDEAHWSLCVTPSDEAFAEAQRVHGKVVEITTPPTADGEEGYDSYEWRVPGEAIVITQFLGEYELVRQLD